MENATSTATAVMNATPAPSSLRCSALVSWGMFTSMARLPRDPDGRGGAPDREAEEEARDDDGHDRAADRATDGHASHSGTTRARLAVVAVDENDRSGQV